MRGEPKLRVEHCLQDMHRVARVKPVGDHQGERAAGGSHEVADAKPLERFQREPGDHAGPANKNS